MRFSDCRPSLVRVITIAAACAALTACASISTGSHYDEGADFGAYKTFSWIDDVPYIVDDSSDRISPLSQSKIQSAIRSGLEKKGYSFTDDRESADFVIAYTVGTREKIQAASYPVEYQASWGWNLYGSYHYPGEATVHRYTEGVLGVDIFDGKSKKPVWHGWAEKTITESDRQDPSSVINQGVSMLFESFPR